MMQKALSTAAKKGSIPVAVLAVVWTLTMHINDNMTTLWQSTNDELAEIKTEVRTVRGDIQRLNSSMATIVEKTGNHESRFGRQNDRMTALEHRCRKRNSN